MFTNPVIADFKSYFVRDFPYGTDIDQNVLDADLSRAIAETAISINPDLFGTQEEYSIAFLLLSAHILCMNLRASSQGLNGKFEWLLGSKSVGAVSVSEQIPQALLMNPVFSFYAKTNYGAQYLIMVYPKLTGNMFAVGGATTP